MHFPTKPSGAPYLRIEGNTGQFTLPMSDGTKRLLDPTGIILDLDIANAVQGWLCVDEQGANWVPLTTRDGWAETPAPSPDHAPGVSLDLMSDAFPEPKVRRLRASSRAVTTFIAGVANTAGDIPAGKAVRVRITGVQLVKIGRGTSVDLSFEVMPRDEWPDLASFDRDPGGPSTTPSSASGDGERDELF